jgi:hypothetical protein
VSIREKNQGRLFLKPSCGRLHLEARVGPEMTLAGDDSVLHEPRKKLLETNYFGKCCVRPKDQNAAITSTKLGGI